MNKIGPKYIKIIMAEIEINIDQAGNVINIRPLAVWLKKLKPGKWLIKAENRRIRTADQNAYYWEVVVPMMQKALYNEGWDEITSTDACHEFLKATHLATVYHNRYTQLKVSIPNTTTKQTTTEFNNYIDLICKWALEYLNIYIPAPNEVLREYEQWEKDLWNGKEISNF